MTKVLSVTEFRSNLAVELDHVGGNDRNQIIIKRPKGKGNVVVLSQDAFNSIQETLYLLSNKANKANLMESIKELKAGNINNWDLVDVTAPTLGEYLLQLEDPMAVLNKLAKSKSLWERRVSVVFTFTFLRAGDLEPTYEMAERHLGDKHDLMHKAVGWLLREMGKRDPGLLRTFLQDYCTEMPRTALRYSIEKFSESERRKWLLTK